MYVRLEHQVVYRITLLLGNVPFFLSLIKYYWVPGSGGGTGFTVVSEHADVVWVILAYSLRREMDRKIICCNMMCRVNHGGGTQDQRTWHTWPKHGGGGRKVGVQEGFLEEVTSMLRSEDERDLARSRFRSEQKQNISRELHGAQEGWSWELERGLLRGILGRQWGHPSFLVDSEHIFKKYIFLIWAIILNIYFIEFVTICFGFLAARHMGS